jgi:hypothetical protein
VTSPQTWQELCAALAARLVRSRRPPGGVIVMSYEEIEAALDIDVVWNSDREFVEIEVKQP